MGNALADPANAYQAAKPCKPLGNRANGVRQPLERLFLC